MKSSKQLFFSRLRISALIILVLGFMIAGSVSATAQGTSSGTVTGTVVDEAEHLPLPGITITAVQGDKTIAGTTTDIDGAFSLKVPVGVTLTFSYLGYVTQKHTPVFGSPMEIVMAEDQQALEEVVVNGYFTRKKNTYTGAAKSLTGDELLSRLQTSSRPSPLSTPV